VIEDFDGPDAAPSRRGHMLVLSLLLLGGVIAGYAAVSSPELRGPYATPRPSVVNAPRLRPAPVASPEPWPTTTLGSSVACASPASVPWAWILVDGPGVIVTSPSQNVTVSVRPSVSNACIVIWGQPPSPIPYDRIAR